MTAMTIPMAGESGIKLPVIQIVPAEGEVMEMSSISCVPIKKLLPIN